MAEQTKPKGWNHARVDSASTSRSSRSPFDNSPRGITELAESQQQQAARSAPVQEDKHCQLPPPRTTSSSSGQRYSPAEATEIRSRSIGVIKAGLERRIRLQAQQTQVAQHQKTVKDNFNLSSTATQIKFGNEGPGATTASTQPSGGPGGPGPTQSPMQTSTTARYEGPAGNPAFTRSQGSEGRQDEQSLACSTEDTLLYRGRKGRRGNNRLNNARRKRQQQQE
ncbi:hypothetical protein QBC42DRAFT_282693 [Cladorrhinum samala]|uniref:Uncharacterized protein n=1 Tax=Cladorrhinum samala TaxID=585594 RepID=A0AAV9HZ78_9PEZI|nr:hypothetical protein QBC42DRAFT_282693 [Cladorrhinum samala]